MIPKEIYTLGAVRFNTQPLAQLKGQLLAKKAAKEEALNKYFTDLQGKINTAGVRTKDLKLDPKNPASPGILTDIENWQKDWSANRESISKGGLAQQEHLNKFNEIVRKIQQSKDRVKNLDEVSKLKQQGKINEEDLPIIDKIDASIYDPKGYKEDGVTEYGIGDFSEFVPTWDVPKIKQFVDYAAAGMEPAGKADEKTIIDPYTKRKVTTFDKVYTQDQLMKMAEKAIAIESDKGGYKTFNKILQEGERDIPSDQFISLAKAYNIVSPNDIMDTPLKVAAASIVLNKMGVVGSGRTSEAKPGSTGGGTGGGIGGGPTGRIDLTTYRDVGENKDVTDIFQGVKVTGLPKGESMLAKQVLYDQKKNEVTVTEWVGRDLEGNPIGQQTRTIPYDVFLQNIKTLNPQTDFRYIETLPKAKTGKAPSSLTMKESEYRNLSVAKRQEFLSKGGVVVK